MDKQEYQNKLEAIIRECGEEYWSDIEHGDGDHSITVTAALQAICLLNEEAIGADEEYPTSHANMVMLKMEGQYGRKRNQLRQELKQIIGVSNER